jgi:hypothetical protein
MSVKTTAELNADAAALITGQVNPDTVTQVILGGYETDQNDSAVNKKDLIIIDPVTGNPTSLLAWLQNQVTLQIQNNTGTMNGTPGQFSVSVNEDRTFTSPTTLSRISLLKDDEEGYFDNGANWDGAKFRVPATGNYKFQLTDLEMQVVKPPTAATSNFTISIDKVDASGAIVTNLASGTFNVTTGAVAGDPIYMQDIITAVTALTQGDLVAVHIIHVNGTMPVVVIKGMNFNNLGL